MAVKRKNTKQSVAGPSLYEIKEVGKVTEVKEGAIKVKGLPNCVYGQLLHLASLDVYGMVIGFDAEVVLVLPFFRTSRVKIGDEVNAEEGFFKFPVGENYLGRVVSSLGEAIDGNPQKIEAEDYLPIFTKAPGVLEREPLDTILQTGIKIVDSVIPVGKGQRELIIGDRQIGKTTIAVDTILNQKEQNVVCIYCWIGGAASGLSKTLRILRASGAIDYTIVVSADASTSIGEQYLAPYAATTLGEYFMHKGRDVLVVFDDLTKHAWMYRQFSLLIERSPGREAYPGDIFYLHSQIMERAGKLNAQLGGGTMTFLPIAEALQGDITGYVQSNLISMTDGQIYLSGELFREGFKPAIDVGLSVSRIGSKVQPQALKQVSRGLRLDYLQYREFLRLLRLRTRLAEEAKEKMRRGEALTFLFLQPANDPVSLIEEVVVFYAFQKKILEILSPEGRKRFKQEMVDYLLENNPDLAAKIKKNYTFTPEIELELTKAFSEFCRNKEIF